MSTTAPRPPDMSVHILKVTLLDVTPPVWRLLRVPSEVTLAALHTILQMAFGWEDRHLHEWRVGEQVYSGAEEDWGDEALADSEVTLAEVAGPDTAISYEYDLGDGWEHLVEVTSVLPYHASSPPVEVLDGARSVPPEDSGGPAGYEHLLDALANPNDEEHEEVLAWVGDWFDPAAFDRQAANRRLETLWRR